jgi:transcriptional regulator with XRE-family HTH domain
VDDLHAQFCAEARQRLADLGWTQEQLAQRLGLKQPNVAAILSGKHKPTLATVQKVAKALNCSTTLKLPCDAAKLVVTPKGDGKSSAAQAAVEALNASGMKSVIFVEGQTDIGFFDLIRARLEVIGMSQKELAEKLKTSPQRVSNALTGKHKPSLETMAKYAEAVGCVLVCYLRDASEPA